MINADVNINDPISVEVAIVAGGRSTVTSLFSFASADTDSVLIASTSEDVSGDYTSEELVNVSSVVYTVNDVVVSIPFSVAVGDKLEVAITRTDEDADSSVTITAQLDNESNTFNSTSFSPIDLAPKLWLDATDTDTVNKKNAADFNASNLEYLSSSSSDFKTGSAFAISCWVQVDAVIGQQVIFGRLAGGGNICYELVLSSSNKWAFTTGFNGTGAEVQVADSGTVMPDTWYFLMCYYDGATETGISVNGGAFTTATVTGVFVGTTDALIGRDGFGTYLTGGLDDLAFWSAKPTDDLRDSVYNSGSGKAYEDLTAGEKTNLVSWWDMNEPSGTRTDLHGTNDLTDNNTVTTREGKVQSNPNEGDSIFQWDDKSGNANHATQAVGSNQPTLTGTTINFAGGDKYFTVPDFVNVVDNYTAFIVLDFEGGAIAEQFLNLDNSEIQARRESSGDATPNSLQVSSAANGVTVTKFDSGLLGDTTYLITIKNTGGTIVNFVDDVAKTLVTTSTLPDDSVNTIGTTGVSSYKGQMIELIIYSSSLTGDQVSDVESYLNLKHAIY